jgi:hypothetical protein
MYNIKKIDNVVIKKNKSGKCHVYDTSWNEKKVKR